MGVETALSADLPIDEPNIPERRWRKDRGEIDKHTLDWHIDRLINIPSASTAMPLAAPLELEFDQSRSSTSSTNSSRYDWKMGISCRRGNASSLSPRIPIAVFLLVLTTSAWLWHHEQIVIATSTFLLSPSNKNTVKMTLTTTLTTQNPHSSYQRGSIQGGSSWIVFDHDDIDNDNHTVHNSHNQSEENSFKLYPQRNLNIAFVGDSVMRFQYMSFIYYLHHRRHVTARDVPNPLDQNALQEKQHRNAHGNGTIDFTSILLRPHEQCDCYRPFPQFEPEVIVDNRYYWNLSSNISVTFVQKYGIRTARGHWNSSTGEIHNPPPPGKKNSSTYHLGPAEYPWNWEGDWEYVIRNHLACMKPRPPRYLIWNAGNHPHDLWNATTRDSIWKALKEVGIISIYKTTTYLSNGTLASSATPSNYEDEICRAAAQLAPYHYCMNMSWTKTLGSNINAASEGGRNSSYFDHVHLTWEPNRRANMQLLSLLRDIELQHQAQSGATSAKILSSATGSTTPNKK